MGKRMRGKRRPKPRYREMVISWWGFVLILIVVGLIGLASVQRDNQKSSNDEEITGQNQEILSTEASTKGAPTKEPSTSEMYVSTESAVTLADIPEYAGAPYITVNNNVPKFKDTELTTTSYEFYSELDALGRCGVVHACIGKDIMPTEERGNIGQVKPSGWNTVKYNDLVDGNYLYNRCHLIGFQLTGENANVRNLITGTRYMNVEGMLPFENMIADYVEETGNHVMYRVTPMFEGDNLVASGVLMEAKSVEDHGEGILFNVYCYNVQPGITIHYATGDSERKEQETQAQQGEPVIANKNSNTYHKTDCSHLPKEKNRVYFDSEVEANVAGYDNPCDYCNP